jgi:predicted transcriptional regulator
MLWKKIRNIQPNRGVAMATVCELAAEIVSSHASTTKMTAGELLREIQDVYSALQVLEAGKHLEKVAEAKPALTMKQAFKKDEVICMVCGKGGMKTLARHLRQAHGLKPGQYRKQFGIPAGQSLTAKDYSEARKKMAEERDSGKNLAKAREVRAAELKGNEAAPAEKAAPGKRESVTSR